MNLIKASAALTPEEKATLYEMESGAKDKLAPFLELKKMIQSETKNLNAMLKNDVTKLTHTVKSTLPSLVSGLSRDANDLLNSIDDYNAMIRNENLMQIDSLTDRIKDIYMRERKRSHSKYEIIREGVEEELEDPIEEIEKDENRMVTKEMLIDSISSFDEIISQVDVNDEIQNILSKRAEEKWNSKFRVKLIDYITTQRENRNRQIIDKHSTIIESIHDKNSRKCIDKVDAANSVLDTMKAFWDDRSGIGERRDLLEGSSIVYGPEWTSDSYEPFPQQYQKKNNYSMDPKIRLGEVSWRKYIPQDWERLLPDGWKDWDVSFLQRESILQNLREFIPAYVWHSLPSTFSSFARVFGVFQVASPKAVLDPNTNLGSCWPMEGRSGRITFRLAQPVHAQNVTVEHFPHVLDDLQPNGSAPRFIRVVGYPPCEHKNDSRYNKECKLMGFDVEKAYDLVSFEYKSIYESKLQNDPFTYDLENDDKLVEEPSTVTRSIQTFNIPITNQENDDQLNSTPDCGSSESTSSMMPSGGGSCTAPPLDALDDESDMNIEVNNNLVAGLSFIVNSNWGNPDFTCIYRLRLHGNTAF